jgi:hypothetical protein
VRMKSQADKHRSKRQFQVGDLALLKLQPYVQSSLAPHANQKLAFKYFGPFAILQRVGKVAYKLGLPRHSNLHPIFHVSQLKPAVGTESASMPPCGFWCLKDKTIKELISFVKCEIGKISCDYVEAIHSSRHML